MKTNKLLYFALALILALGMMSCRELETIDPNIDIPGLGGTEEVENELDIWLKENFTAPYNIEVVYRWESAQMYTSLSSSRLVPIEYDIVKPMMAAIRDVWFEPYNKVAGPTFIKMLSPKKVVLVGSPEYQFGSIKLGQAEGGNKILLLNANNFDATNEADLKQMLHTIMHEFGHILHQKVMFDKSFQDISAGYYDASGWKEFDRTTDARNDYNPESWALGFVRNYAMNNKDDDFVEILSMVCVYGRKWFDEQVCEVAKASTTNPNAYAALQAKLAIVESYLQTVWNVRFFDDPADPSKKGLETYVQQAVKRVIETPPTE